jgi:hypothetical protein
MDLPVRFRAVIGRFAVAAIGVAVALVAAYRIPVWWSEWRTPAFLAVVLGVALVLVGALWIAARGTEYAVRRTSAEVLALGCALLVAEGALLLNSPASWSANPRVQREIVQSERARAQGLRYDGRVRAEAASDLGRLGLPAMPGYSADMSAHPAVAAAVHERGLLPLSNASRSYIVECNEGSGFLQFRSDELGFNNPPGLALGPAQLAVFGESLAVGHCVPPGASVVDLVRTRYPRTANFGVAGARVLSQLAVFREYIEPLEPSLVVWFVNVSYAEAGQESAVPLLERYLDPSFSQGLRERQDEVDSFAREVLVPLRVREEGRLKDALADARRFPFGRLIALREIRGLIDLRPSWQPERSDLGHFQRALGLVSNTTRAWGGKLFIVVLPGFGIATRQTQSVARYHAVREALSRSGVRYVDGPSVFASAGDAERLFALGIDNHPNERGHAVLANALIAALNKEEDLP